MTSQHVEQKHGRVFNKNEIRYEKKMMKTAHMQFGVDKEWS